MPGPRIIGTNYLTLHWFLRNEDGPTQSSGSLFHCFWLAEPSLSASSTGNSWTQKRTSTMLMKTPRRLTVQKKTASMCLNKRELRQKARRLLKLRSDNTSSPCCRLNTIPDNCLFFTITFFWGLKILHSKVRKFARRIASRQNSVNHHHGAQIDTYIYVFICMLCAKVYTLCKITHYVWNYTLCVRLHI